MIELKLVCVNFGNFGRWVFYGVASSYKLLVKKDYKEIPMHKDAINLPKIKIKQ